MYEGPFENFEIGYGFVDLINKELVGVQKIRVKDGMARQEDSRMIRHPDSINSKRIEILGTENVSNSDMKGFKVDFFVEPEQFVVRVRDWFYKEENEWAVFAILDEFRLRGQEVLYKKFEKDEVFE